MKNSKDGGCTASLGNHGLTILVEKNVPPYNRPEPLLFQLMAVDTYPTAVHRCEQPGSLSSVTPTSAVRGTSQVPPKPPFLQPKPGVPNPSTSPHTAAAPAPNHLGGPLLNSFQFINVFPVLRASKPAAVSRRALKEPRMLSVLFAARAQRWLMFACCVSHPYVPFQHGCFPQSVASLCCFFPRCRTSRSSLLSFLRFPLAHFSSPPRCL